MNFLKNVFTTTTTESSTETTTSTINNSNKPIRIFKYASDIHLEMTSKSLESLDKLRGIYEFEKKENHRYFLALVGDIGSPFYRENMLISFLKLCSEQYERVFYVMGNHEYYNQLGCDNSMIEIKNELRNICCKFENVHLLDNEIFELDDDYKIIGTTLWSDVDKENEYQVGRCLNDYNLIKINEKDDIIDNDTGKIKTRKLIVSDSNSLHKEAIKFLKWNIFEGGNENNLKCLLLTHHAPQFNDHKNKTFTSHPKYRKDDSIGQAFSTDLSKLIKPPIKAIIYGHTHYSTDYTYNGVKILSNQYGYQFGEDLDECKFNTNCEFILN